MQVSGEALTSIVSNLDLGSGTNFFGTTLTGSTDATITLTNPNPDILSYQAEALGWVDVDVEFNVWGDPAPFSLSGSLSAQYYDVELEGDESIMECDSSDNPCSTISTAGELPPGSYDLSMAIDINPFIASPEKKQCVAVDARFIFETA